MTIPGWGPHGSPGTIEIPRALLQTGSAEEPFPGVAPNEGATLRRRDRRCSCDGAPWPRDPRTVSNADASTSAPAFDPVVLREKYRAERDKRIRVDGNAQYVEVAGPFADYLRDPYTEAVDRPSLDDDVTVAVIGGGFAGLITGRAS